jgi:CRP-like cAMP-binding protein
MKKICEVLAATPLFESIDHEAFGEHCGKTSLRIVWKGEMLAVEGDECTGIGIVQEGQLAMQKYTSGGDCATLGLMGPGEMFGESLLFGHTKVYPVTIEAVTNSRVLILPKETVLELLDANPRIMKNFLAIMSDRVCMLNRRIALLSQKTLRQKIAYYLLELWAEQKIRDRGEKVPPCVQPIGDPEEIVRLKEPMRPGHRVLATPAVELPVSKEVVARLLSMPRPSLSRELISMENDGLIKVSGRVIWMVDVPALERGILEGFKVSVDDD